MPRPLRILVSRHSVFYAPVIAAVSAGFLADEGIEATYAVKPAGRGTFDMLAAAEADIVQSAVSSNWSRLEKGHRDLPLHFAQINCRDGFWVTARDPAPFAWKSLEGRVLLADHGPQPLAMLQYAARCQGVDWSRVRLLDAGGPDDLDRAFRSGQGDFVHQQGPAPQQLEADGVGRIVASVGEAMPPVAFSSLMAKRTFLDRAEARAFMNAFRRALAWVRESAPADVAAPLTPLFERFGSVAIEGAVAAYQRLGCWRADPRIPEADYAQALEVFIDAGAVGRRHRYRDVVVDPPAGEGAAANTLK